MSSHVLTDKSLQLEARGFGFAAADARPFPEPGVPAHYGPDRAFTIEHIDLRLRIDPREPGLQGEALVRIAPRPAGLGEVVLDLEDVVAHAVTDAKGRALSWRQADGKLRVRGLPEQGGTVRVLYSGRPHRGLYFTGPTAALPDRQHMAWTQCQDEDGHHVFPCIDHPSVKHPFTIRVTVPDGFEVVSNGVLDSKASATQGADPQPGWTTWTWRQQRPIPAYLFTVVVGELDVHDDHLGELPVRYIVPRGTDPETVQRVFSLTPRIIALYNQTFGVDYAWPRYDQVVVHDFIFGGMENAGATTLTDLVLTDERADLDWNADDLIAHELAHQWFGDLVTCQDWSQGWLNEGWATYSEFIWRSHDLDQDEADYQLFAQLGGYLGEAGGRYRRSVIDYRFRHPIDLFDRHLYEKGGLILHTLRGILGEAGFWAGARLYLEGHTNGTVHTRDLQRAMETATGRNLDGFFQQFVHGAGHPQVEVKLSHGDGLLTVSVVQKQEGTDVSDAFHFPLRLAIVRGDQVQTLTLPVRERSRAWTLPCAEAPDRVEVDAGFHLLADLSVQGGRSLLEGSLRGDASVVGRIRAARALAKEGSPAAISALIEALGDQPFWGMRASVAGLLAKNGGTRARQALIAAIEDEHPKARRAIVAALGELRHPDCAAALRGILAEGDPSVQVEGAAAKAFGQQRTDDAVDTLRPVLDRDSWGEKIRAGALQGLSWTRDPAALPLLLEWTGDDRPDRARAAASAGLGRLADEVQSVRSEAVDRLVQLAQEAPFRVQFSAIGALGSARDPRATAPLRALHESLTDGRMARAAYESLQKLAAGRTSDTALAGLKQDMETLRNDNRALRERLDKLEDTSPSA